jgi:hypothetical protein
MPRSNQLRNINRACWSSSRQHSSCSHTLTACRFHRYGQPLWVLKQHTRPGRGSKRLGQGVNYNERLLASQKICDPGRSPVRQHQRKWGMAHKPQPHLGDWGKEQCRQNRAQSLNIPVHDDHPRRADLTHPSQLISAKSSSTKSFS